LSSSEAARIERALRAGDLDLIYIAPERLMLARTLELLVQCRLALFAIDEAHCVSQWGHDFRPEYGTLSLLRERWPEVPRIALTATADGPTRQEIVSKLLVAPREFVASFDRPNIRYRIIEKNEPREQLLRFIRTEHANEAGIVYCLARATVEEVADFLTAHDVPALPYHAGLPPETRRAAQERFMREDGLIIVATIAFGMASTSRTCALSRTWTCPRASKAISRRPAAADAMARPRTHGLRMDWRTLCSNAG